MLKERSDTLVGTVRGVDIGLITLSFYSGTRLLGVESSRLVFWPSQLISRQPHSASDQYALILVISIVAWVLITYWRGTYLTHRSELSRLILHRHLATLLIWSTLLALSVFALGLNFISRSFFLLFIALSASLLAIRQTLVHLFLRFFRLRGFNLRQVVVLGNPRGAERLANIISSQPTTGYRVVAINDLSFEGIEPNNTIDEVFVVAGGDLDDRLLLKLVTQGKRLHFVPGGFDVRPFRRSLDDLAGIPMLSIGGYGLTYPEAAIKRGLDVLGATFLLALCSPLLLVTALLVKISSPGPIIFAQERLGEKGQRFRIYKFRSMYSDSERVLHSNQLLYAKYVKNNYKLPEGEDPRITPVGRFLRSTSLDELPQLFNVLKGDMSLVGPRPIVPPEIEKYGEYAPLFLSIKPGLTGNWQVNGRSTVVDYRQRAALDVEYIRDQSLKTDFELLLRTIPAVLFRKGAH